MCIEIYRTVPRACARGCDISQIEIKIQSMSRDGRLDVHLKF